MGKPHHLLRSVLEFPWEGLLDVVIIGLKQWKLSQGSAVWKCEIKVWIGHAPSETCGGILSGLFLVCGGVASRLWCSLRCKSDPSVVLSRPVQGQTLQQPRETSTAGGERKPELRVGGIVAVGLVVWNNRP